MKNIRIRQDAFQIDEFAKKIRRHFYTRYIVTDNGRNEVIIAKNKTIGCKIILTKKRMMISGTFPTLSSTLLALLILILGGIIIPMAVYIFSLRGKFEAVEKEVHEYILSEFPDHLL